MKTKFTHIYQWLLISLIGFSTFSGAYAQFNTQARYEVTLTKGIIQEDFRVLSLKRKGLLFLAMREKWNQPGMDWEIVRMDTTLKEVWKVEEQLDKLFELTDAYYDENQFVYIMLTRYEKSEFKILKLDIKDGKIETFEGKLPLKAELTKMRATRDYIFLIGAFQTDIVALRYNTLDGTTKVVPSVYSKTYNNLDVYGKHSINAGFFMMANSRNCDFQVNTFSNIVGVKTGKKLELNKNKKYKFHSATLYPISATESLVLGTYSRKCFPFPQGVATIRIQNGKQSKPVINKFIDFKNFFNYYSPKKVERIRRKIVKKAKKGKEYTLGSRMALQDIIESENNENLLVVAERYWYRNKAIPASMLQRGRIPLEPAKGEFQFNSASISAYNRKGVKQWDNTIRMKHGVMSSGLTPVVRVGFKDDKVILAYMRQRRPGVTPMVCSKLIQQGKTIKKEVEEEVKNLDDNDRIYSSENQNFIHWYGDVFLLWGEQVVVNRHVKDLSVRREVAFVNKMRFDKNKLTEKEKKKLEKKNGNKRDKKLGKKKKALVDDKERIEKKK